MGAGIHGGFGGTVGAGDDKHYVPRSSVDLNAKRMSNDYPLTSNGYFGEKGKNVRIIKTPTPETTSSDFYMKLGWGGKTEQLKNGHGTRTTLDDGTIIVHRLITSTKGSPAVDIKVIHAKTVKSQKVHFIKEGS